MDWACAGPASNKTSAGSRTNLDFKWVMHTVLAANAAAMGRSFGDTNGITAID